jgi:hypothetical protein
LQACAARNDHQRCARAKGKQLTARDRHRSRSNRHIRGCCSHLNNRLRHRGRRRWWWRWRRRRRRTRRDRGDALRGAFPRAGRPATERH